MPMPSSTGLSTMPTASSCGATRCAAANRRCLGMKRINQINNFATLIHTINTIHNRPQQSLETIIMTRVLALAGQSKIGCITQRRFAKVGTKTHPQRGAALDRNGLSVSTETACRFEPKSPVGNSEICRRCHDNIFVERLWWTVKHEWVYLRPAANGIEQKRSLAEFFDWYNLRRPHQALGWRTPDEAYRGQSVAATALAA